MNTSSYPLLFKHGIISNSDNDPGYVITFLMDRMAMADKKADDREGQMWIRVQSNEQFWSSFSGINFVSEIRRIGKILNTSVSVDEIDDLINEALLFSEKEFNSEQRHQGGNLLNTMAMADGDFDDRELDLLFKYSKIDPPSHRIKNLEYYAQTCKERGFTYSDEKIQSLINKVKGTESELKKKIEEPKWKLGAIEIFEDDGSEKVLNQYLKSVDVMIQSLNDQPIKFLQNNTKYLKKVREEAKENGNCIDGDYFIFFAFSSNAEECAELMRIKSGESQFEARFHFHDLSSNKFCFQSVNNGEWESGWITDSPKDEFFSSDLMGFKVPEMIKDNLKILEKNGSKELHENLPNAEQKKETVLKQMIALPDGTTADLMDTSHWNMGAFELHYEDGEEEGLKEYLEIVQKMVTILGDQPIVFLQDNNLFLEKVFKESKEQEYCIEVYLWFAFPGKAEKCAEVMRTISGEAQFYGAINFYDMFEKRFWYQGVDHGEWETGWIESGYDKSYFSTYFEGLGIPEDIKTNYEYLKNNGLDEFKDYLHSNVLLDESDWTEAYINQLYNDKNYVEGAKKGDELILKLAKNQNFNIHHCCDIAMDEDNRFPVDVKIALTSNPNLEGYMITEMFERDKRFNYKDPEYRKVDELLLKHPNCPKDFISKHIHKFQSEPVSKPDVVSDVKTLTIKCDGNFSKGNLLGLSVYSYDSSNHDTIMNTLKSTEDINAEVMDNLPIKLIKDYYGFRDSSFLSINLNNSPLSVNIKNNEVDFSKDLENDSLLIQEFPISGLISIELEHSKDIIFNQNQIKHFPNNSLITSVLVSDEEYDFYDYTDPHTYFSDQFFTKTFSKKNEKQPSKKQLESKNLKEKNVPAWKKIKTAMESFGPLYAAEYGEIMDYCDKHFGEVKKSTFRTYIISCTVNHNSRIHYSPNKKERKDLLDNDVLYQVEEGMVTLYEPKKHGHWYIKKGNEGKLHIEKF